METFGIDIPKDVFDCYGSIQGHVQFFGKTRPVATTNALAAYFRNRAQNSLIFNGCYRWVFKV